MPAAEFQQFLGFVRIAIGVATVELPGPAYLVRVVHRDDAGALDEADEGPRRECAPAEPEDEDLVPGPVVEDQEAVGLLHVRHQTLSEGASAEGLVRRRPDTLVVEHDLVTPVVGDGWNALREQHDVGRVLLDVELVPGSIEAEDEPPGLRCIIRHLFHSEFEFVLHPVHPHSVAPGATRRRSASGPPAHPITSPSWSCWGCSCRALR